ncbi:MAG: 4Fe-4S dicluster domain-containing protein [Theionarchaea archaeon]|nr:4Fe-4S dicluster domain-containing protein [Theionarchaea archaeon]
MREINFRDADNALRDTVKEFDDTITYCFQCGTCTASCPVFEVYPDYNPRKIIRMLLLGMKEVLSEDFVWLCSSCYACQERCPQGVLIPHLMRALTNMAFSEGYVPRGVLDQYQKVRKEGVLYRASSYDNRKRKNLGLEKRTEEYDVSKIFEGQP